MNNNQQMESKSLTSIGGGPHSAFSHIPQPQRQQPQKTIPLTHPIPMFNNLNIMQQQYLQRQQYLQQQMVAQQTLRIQQMNMAKMNTVPYAYAQDMVPVNDPFDVNMSNRSSGNGDNKSRNCRFYGSALGCRFDSACTYSHDNPNSVRVCRFGDQCTFGDRCHFRHKDFDNDNSFSLFSDNKDVPMCRFEQYPSGCSRGESCRFRHVNKDIDNKDNQDNASSKEEEEHKENDINQLIQDTKMLNIQLNNKQVHINI